MFGGKITGKIALKHIGKYKKYELDQRVQKLIEYYPEKQWKINEVEDEIKAYDNVRKFKFFKNVHKLENIIYNHAKKSNKLDCLNNNNNGNPNFKKYIEYYSDNIKYCSDKDLSLLVKIRNKFSHNQLIDKESFKSLTEKIPIIKNIKISDYLNDIFVQHIQHTC